jgi:hypothetical protein
MTQLPTIYTARSDVEAAQRTRVEEWYARRHAPDLIRAGFHTAQVYYSDVGTPLVCNLYEIPGPALFQTQAYRDVAANDTEGPAVIALLTSRSNTIYDQVLTVGPPGVGVEARCLTTLRFDLPAGEEAALLDWYASEEFPRLQARPGFVAGRLCRQGPPHPTAPSRDPRWFVIHEWEEPAAALRDGTTAGAPARHGATFGDRVSRIAYNFGRRNFRLAREVA